MRSFCSGTTRAKTSTSREPLAQRRRRDIASSSAPGDQPRPLGEAGLARRWRARSPGKSPVIMTTRMPAPRHSRDRLRHRRAAADRRRPTSPTSAKPKSRGIGGPARPASRRACATPSTRRPGARPSRPRVEHAPRSAASKSAQLGDRSPARPWWRPRHARRAVVTPDVRHREQPRRERIFVHERPACRGSCGAPCERERMQRAPSDRTAAARTPARRSPASPRERLG